MRMRGCDPLDRSLRTEIIFRLGAIASVGNPPRTSQSRRVGVHKRPDHFSFVTVSLIVASDYANRNVTLWRRRARIAPPIKPKPRIIVAQVEGSGTGDKTSEVFSVPTDPVP